MTPTAQTRRIALLMGQDVSFCRRVIRGVRAYAIGKPDWVFHNGLADPETLRLCRPWKPHGIIAHLSTQPIARRVLKMDCPVVDVACVLSNLKAAVVDVDHAAVGRAAAEHFLDCGFGHFGFYGSRRAHYSRLREAAFRRHLAEAGRALSSCYCEYLTGLPAPGSWGSVDRRVQDWLEGLPKPVAVLTSNDTPARHLADICRQVGLHIPEEVSLLGVDNDELECCLTAPPLSSIAVPAEQIGYEAARLLEGMMSGAAPPENPLFLAPLGVVTRQSTDTLAMPDRSVAAALAFIRHHAADDIDVAMVAEEAVLSRRTLECRFRRLLGRTVLDEIRRTRVEIAKELLASTELAMPAVARRSGFANAQRLAVVFRQVTGMAPTAYRRRSRIRGV
jgi:LacI family transcriptional regulator